jgi:hypothetical protein
MTIINPTNNNSTTMLLLLIILIYYSSLPLAVCAYSSTSSSKSSPSTFSASAYFKTTHTADETISALDSLCLPFTESLGCQTFSIGKSAEKRPLKMLKVGKGPHAVFIMATLHGREWIAPLATQYAIYDLMNKAKSGNDGEMNKMLVQDVTLYVLPLINPDGYQYTRTPITVSETARQWRKNRRLLPCKGEKCVHGIDLNRNWGIAGKTFGFGATRATSDVYQGKRPFSEPELLAIKTWLSTNNFGSTIGGILDVHCCASVILPPSYYHGESETIRKEHLDIAGRIAKSMSSLSKVDGVIYGHREREREFGPTNSGISVDWLYGESGAKLAFIVETRPANRHTSKKLEGIFDVDGKYIPIIGLEVEAAIKQIVQEVLEREKNVPVISTSVKQTEHVVGVEEEKEKDDIFANSNVHITSRNPIIHPQPNVVENNHDTTEDNHVVVGQQQQPASSTSKPITIIGSELNSHSNTVKVDSNNNNNVEEFEDLIPPPPPPQPPFEDSMTESTTNQNQPQEQENVLFVSEEDEEPPLPPPPPPPPPLLPPPPIPSSSSSELTSDEKIQDNSDNNLPIVVALDSTTPPVLDTESLDEASNMVSSHEEQQHPSAEVVVDQEISALMEEVEQVQNSVNSKDEEENFPILTSNNNHLLNVVGPPPTNAPTEAVLVNVPYSPPIIKHQQQIQQQQPQQLENVIVERRPRKRPGSQQQQQQQQTSNSGGSSSVSTGLHHDAGAPAKSVTNNNRHVDFITFNKMDMSSPASSSSSSRNLRGTLLSSSSSSGTNMITSTTNGIPGNDNLAKSSLRALLPKRPSFMLTFPVLLLVAYLLTTENRDTSTNGLRNIRPRRVRAARWTFVS